MAFATHILVPTDFSDASKLACDAAAVIAARFGAKVTLVHVHDHDALRAPANLGYSPARRAELAEEVHAMIEEKLADARDRCFAGCDVTAELLEDASAAHAICTHAEKIGADLIVISTHGRTGLRHLLIGSVTERVVRHASVPVLTLRSHAAD